MLVSNNNLLNILLPNNNKVLNDALKDADVKTLNNLKSGDTTVSNILKNLFNDLKTCNKTNSTIENILKNTSLFKDLGSFTQSITTLLNQLNKDSNLAKYKPLLQNFLKDITTLDDNSLKDMINKSGVFLESKALEQLTKGTNLPKSIETLLLQIKNILKDIPNIEAKKIETLVDKILQNSSNKTLTLNNESVKSQLNQAPNSQDIKSLLSMLQNLTKSVGDKQLSNLTLLTNSLKNLSDQAQLIESKISNQVEGKSSINQNNIESVKQNILTNTKETLTQLKTELLAYKNTTNIPTLLKQIDSLLQSSNLFTKNETMIEPKNLINQLINLNEIKTASNQNHNIANIINNLKNQVETISLLENKLLQNQNIQVEKTQLNQEINQTLNSLKNELTNIKNIDTKLINQIIDKLLNLQNIFNKLEIPLDLKKFQQNISNQNSLSTSFQSNFSSNVNTLILSLKELISNLGTNQQNSFTLQQNIIKIVEKLENSLNSFMQLNTNSINKEEKQNQNPLQNDMKTLLLQIQEELSSKTDSKSLDTIKQIDKMITQVEYFQLLSITTNSNSVYIPFIWDMLDEGSISMKKLDEEKFYCEINLSLKEFGQTQLMLALYDKNKLDLTIYASKESFKQTIRKNFLKLKQALNSVDLIPVNIKIIDLKKEEEAQKTQSNNIYNNQTSNLGLGLDIRV